MAATLVNLATPVRSERVRAGFQPHWRTVFIYRCERRHETRVFASSFTGQRATPGVGAIYCPQCDCTPEEM